MPNFQCRQEIKTFRNVFFLILCCTVGRPGGIHMSMGGASTFFDHFDPKQEH